MVALGILLILVSLLLIGIVLIQKGRGGGLSGAFGGGSQTFGTRTGDALTWATIVLTVLFLGLTITMTLVAKWSIPHGTVATPTFKAPADTTNKGYGMVILATETDGAKIRYTLDGKEPTEDSETYDFERDAENNALGVKVNLNQTIKARAYRNSPWKPSEIMTFTYEGKAAPVVVIPAAPASTAPPIGLDPAAPVTDPVTTPAPTIDPADGPTPVVPATPAPTTPAPAAPAPAAA